MSPTCAPLMRQRISLGDYKEHDMTSQRRFAVIGYGAITEELVACLEERGDLDALAAVLVRPSGLAGAMRRAEGRFPVVDRLEALLETKPDAIVECAGHEAVRQ